MTNYIWRIKALTNTGEIAKGMEIEVITNGTNTAPTENQIKKAFEAKFKIEAPNDFYGNNQIFRIIRPLKQPSFFYDNSGGNPAELMFDYFLSWTLRCAIDTEQENISDTVQKSAKCILHFLLKEYLGDISVNEFTVVDVEAVKQWKQIDLFCSVQIRIGDKDTWYILSFENKMYTKLHGNQLKGYTQSIEERYPKSEIKKLFFYLTNHMEVPPEDLVQCEDNEYIPYPIWRIADYLKVNFPERSGNNLFDEFWYNFA